MRSSTERRRAIDKVLTLLIPMVPFSDAEQIRQEAGSRHMKTLPPSIAVWLATVAHIRHQHTDYERLLEEGYERDAARFFVLDAVNAVLTGWRATRLLDPDDEDI